MHYSDFNKFHQLRVASEWHKAQALMHVATTNNNVHQLSHDGGCSIYYLADDFAVIQQIAYDEQTGFVKHSNISIFSLVDVKSDYINNLLSGYVAEDPQPWHQAYATPGQ